MSEKTNKPKDSMRGRDSKTGEFISVEGARKQPNDRISERILKPGHCNVRKCAEPPIRAEKPPKK